MTTNRYLYLFACVSLYLSVCTHVSAQTASVKQYSPRILPGTPALQAVSSTITGITSQGLDAASPIASSYLADPISGPSGGCLGSSITLTHTISGGIWSSSNTSVASVNTFTGVVNLVGNGTATIYYIGMDGFFPFIVSKSITVANVSIKGDVIECNNGVISFNATDTYHGVTYSNTSAGNSYLWTIASPTGSYSFQGSSTATSQYPRMQLANGHVYTVSVLYTTNGVSCSATQVVYKSVTASAAILTSHDTTVCYSTNAVNLSGSVSAVTNNYSWSTNGTGSFSNSNSLSPVYTPSIADKNAGLIKIYFSGSSSYNSTGNCGSSNTKDSITLRFYPNNTGKDTVRTVCSGQSLLYNPFSVQNGSTFTWASSVTSGSVTGNSANGTGNINDLLINSSASSPAVVRYTITPAYAGCTGTPFTLTATVQPNPTLSITNNSTAVCNSTAVNIQLSSSISGSLYSWTSSIISGTASGNTNRAIPASGNNISDVLLNSSSNNATVRYVIKTISPAGCSATDSTTVQVRPLPSVANAGPDQTLCNISSLTLSGNTPAVGTGSWAQVSGPSTIGFANAANPTTSASGFTPGTYVFTWTISNAPCSNSVDTVIIVVSPQTVAGTLSADATVCSGSNSGTLTLSGYTGAVIRWEFSTDNGGNWSNIASNANSYGYSNLTTTTQYRALVQSSPCSNMYSNTVTITVNAPTVPGTATGVATVCSGSNTGNITLSGFTGSVIRWESSTDGISWPTSYPVNTSTYTYSNLTATTYFRAVVQNGVCASAFSNAVLITVNPVTIPGSLGNDATVCANVNSGSLNLSGNNGTITGWEYSINNGGSWNSITNTSSTHNYNNLAATTIFRVAVQSGVCNPAYSNYATITVVPPVSLPNAGTDTAVCNLAAAPLHASLPASGSGLWSFISGPSAVSFSNTADPNAIVNSLTTGTYQFEWTLSNGVCTNLKDTVQMIVYPATVPGVVSAGSTVCAGTNSATLTLSAYTGNITGWQFSTDNGTTWNNIANTTNTITVNNLTTTTQYRASVQSGVCNTLYSTISTITVLQPVTTANAGPDMQLCAVASTALQGNTPTSGTGTWAALPGNPSTVTFSNPNNPTTTVNGLVPGTYQFEWTISNGVCTDSKDIVVVTIDPMTVPGTLAAGQTVCATGNTGSISLSGYTGVINAWEWSDNNGASWNNIANNTSNHSFNNLTTTTLFRAIVKSGSCATLPSNTVTITVLPPPTTANAGTDFAVCNVTATALSANTPTSGTGTWTALTGNPSTVTFTNPNNPNTTVNGLVPGTYQFEWTISNGVCTDSKDVVQVTIVPATTAGILGTDATVCATANSGTLTLTGNNGQIVQWEQSSDYGSNWVPVVNTTNTLNFTNLSSTTQYRVSVKNDICPAQYSNISVINVLPAVTLANAGPDTTFINGVSSYMLQGNVPINGTGTWSVVPGANTTLVFSNYGDPHAVITGLDYIHGTPPTDGYYQLVWTISNGVCGVSRDTMQITVQPPTNPGVVGPDAIVCTGNNDGSVQLSDYLGTILQWEYSINGGTSWIIIPRTVGANQDTLQYHNLTTTTLFRALVKNGVGEELYSGVAATVTVMQEVTPSNAGPDQTLCFRTSTSLAGNMPTSGIGTWTALPGSPTVPNIVNPADPNTIVSGLTVGTYQFVWTISNGLCSDSQDMITVTVVPQTVAGTLITPNTVCATGNTGTLSFSGHTGSILGTEYSTDNGSSWTMIPGSAGLSSITYNNLTTTTQYRTTVQNFVCPALPSNIVTITVLSPVTTADAGTDQQLCNVSSITLNGNNPISGTGKWTLLPGAPSAISFTNDTDPHTTVNGLVPGTYQFEWTISNMVCSDSKDIVTVQIYPATVVGSLTGDAIVCSANNNGTVTLNSYTGDIIRWELSINNGTSWTNISNTSNTITYNNLTQTSIYRTVVQNGPCTILTSNDVTITVIDPVTTANAGNDQELCNVNTVALNANTPTSGTGKWTLAPGAPSAVSFNNDADPNTTVNGLVPGTYQFIWTITNGSCFTSSDAVQITIHPSTVPGILATDATVCATANGNTLNFSGHTGSILGTEFSIDNGSNWTMIPGSAGLSSITYNNLTTTTQYRTTVQNFVCPALPSNIVTITVLSPVTTADAGTDQQLCNVSSITLNGNNPISGTGKWTLLPGAPSAISFTNDTDPHTTVNGLVPGIYQFEWTISNMVCSDSKDIVTVQIYPATVVGSLTGDAIVCSANNNGTVTLNSYTGDIIRWELSINNGTSWTNISNTSNTITYNNLTQTSIYRTVVQNGPCTILTSNDVTITVIDPVTTANAGNDQELCNVNTVALNANTPTSGTGKWTLAPGAPSAVSFNNDADPNTTVNGLVPGTYQFIWTITNGSCFTSSDAVQITIHPSTVPGILATDATVCYNNNGSTMQLTGYTGNILRWEYSIDNGANWLNISNTTAQYSYANLITTTWYRAAVQSGVCNTLYSNTVGITVLQPVTAAQAGIDQRLCETPTANLDANTPVFGTGNWSQIAGPSTANFANSGDPKTAVSNLQPGKYVFVWTISHTMCDDSKDTVIIQIDSLTKPGSLSAPATVCEGTNTGVLTLTGQQGSILHWEFSTDNGNSWQIIADTTAQFSYLNLTQSTLYRVLVQNGVCATSYSNSVQITVLPAVTIADAGANQIVCNTSTVLLNANTPVSGSGIWVLLDGPSGATIQNIGIPTTQVNGLSIGTYRFMWLVSNGICPASSSTTTVSISPATLPGTVLANDTVCTQINQGILQLNGNNGSISRWEYSTDNGQQWQVTDSTLATYTYRGLTANTRYRVLVQSGACAAAYADIADILVNPVTVPGSIIGSDTVCISANSGQLILTNYTGIITHWESSADKGQSWQSIANTTDHYTYSQLTKTTLFRAFVQSGVCDGNYSDTAVITVDEETIAGKLNGVDTVCYTSNRGEIILSGRRGDILRWELGDLHAMNWQSLNATSDTLVYQQLEANSHYRVLVQNGVCAPQYSDTVKITVMPPVTQSNAGDDITVCDGTSTTTLRGNIPSSGTGRWQVLEGPSTLQFADSTAANTQVSNLVAGTYKLAWIISNEVCASSMDTIFIRVDQTKPLFSITAIHDCGKTTYRFTDSSQSNFDLVNWKWSITPGDTLTQKNPEIFFHADGVYTASLTIQTSSGCQQNLQAQFNVSVYEYPKADINAIKDVCMNQLMQASPSVNSKDSIASLLWNMGNGSRSTDSVVNIRYTNEGNYQLKLTVGTINNCFDSVYKQLVVHALPKIVVQGNQTICKGDTVVLRASGATRYAWSDQNNNTICADCNTQSVRPSVTSTYRVIGYSEYGCSDITTVNVRVVQPLKLLIAQGDTLCEGSSKPIAAIGANSYRWYPETGLSNPNIANPVATPMTTTTYNVIGKDAENCFVDTAAIRLVVGRPTPINIGKDTIVTAGTVLQLEARPSVNTIDAQKDLRKWRWSGGASISCATCPNPQIRIVDDATIVAHVVNRYGCASTDTVLVKTVCAETQLFVPNAFSPDGDGINDKLVLQGKGIKMIRSFRIFNRWGAVVFEKTNFLPGDAAQSWDGTVNGKPVTPDVFVYVADVICEKGLPSSFKGNITILK